MSTPLEVSRGLGSADPEERRRAVARIAELPPQGRTAPLLSALGDDDWRVRKEAIGLCAQLGPEPELVAALVNVFEPGENVGLRNAAVEALGGFGGAAVEALSARVPRLDADGKKLSIEALARSGEGAALEVLAPLVEDPDPNVRLAALEALGAVGGERVEAARALLARHLDDARPLETLAALESLALLGGGLPYERIERWLSDPLLGRPALALAAQSADPKAAAPLVRALLVDATPEPVRALAEYVGSSELARRAASAELSHTGERGERSLLRWLERGDGDVECACAALTVVGALGIGRGAGPAVGWLADPRCYAEADQALFLLGGAAIPELLAGARRPGAETAAACLDLLGRLPFPTVTSAVRGALCGALSAPSADVVRAALGALTRVGDADCIPELVRLLREPPLVPSVEPTLAAVSQRHPEQARGFVQIGSLHGSSPHATALVIAALGPRDELGALDRGELASFCTRLLASTSHDERRAALLALGALGAPDALDSVRFALADEEATVRLEAVRTLGLLKGQDGIVVGVPALLEVVSASREPGLTLAALRALGESSDSRALAVLGPLVRSSDARVAVAAVEALSRHGDARRLSSLFDGLHHSEPEVVKAAMLAIAAEPDPRVVVHLGACLDQPAWDVRRLAADLLGRSPSEASAALLRARLTVEPDPMVKEALSRALEGAGQRRSRSPRRALPLGEG